MKKPDILVTGGAGFIGSHVVERLVNFGYRVKVLDNLSTGKLANIRSQIEQSEVDFIQGDITDAKLVKKCVRGVSAVVHLAAITSVPFSIENPSLTHKTNVIGTLNLFESSINEKISKFVLISSCAVYGDSAYLPIDEQHPLNPISPYAKSKLEAEQFCMSSEKAQYLKPVILRLFNVYGPRQGTSEYSGVITRFIHRIKQDMPPIIYGDGSQTRDFVSVHDVVSAILSALENDDADGEAFNIGSGKPVTLHTLVEKVLPLRDAKLRIVYEKPRAVDIKHSHANISKAKRILRYAPRVPLDDGLQELFVEHSFSPFEAN